MSFNLIRCKIECWTTACHKCPYFDESHTKELSSQLKCTEIKIASVNSNPIFKSRMNRFSRFISIETVQVYAILDIWCHFSNDRNPFCQSIKNLLWKKKTVKIMMWFYSNKLTRGQWKKNRKILSVWLKFCNYKNTVSHHKTYAYLEWMQFQIAFDEHFQKTVFPHICRLHTIESNANSIAVYSGLKSPSIVKVLGSLGRKAPPIQFETVN